MSWQPHVTLAVVVEQAGRFLLVHEQTDEGRVYNQPAGHLECDETFVQGAAREALEETGWRVEVTALLALSRYVAPSNGVTYVRISFAATAVEHLPKANLDEGIIEAVWLSYDEICAKRNQLRSPLVLNDIERYRRGQLYPLELVCDFPLK